MREEERVALMLWRLFSVFELMIARLGRLTRRQELRRASATTTQDRLSWRWQLKRESARPFTS